MKMKDEPGPCKECGKIIPSTEDRLCVGCRYRSKFQEIPNHHQTLQHRLCKNPGFRIQEGFKMMMEAQ